MEAYTLTVSGGAEFVPPNNTYTQKFSETSLFWHCDFLCSLTLMYFWSNLSLISRFLKLDMSAGREGLWSPWKLDMVVFRTRSTYLWIHAGPCMVTERRCGCFKNNNLVQYGSELRCKHGHALHTVLQSSLSKVIHVFILSKILVSSCTLSLNNNLGCKRSRKTSY